MRSAGHFFYETLILFLCHVKDYYNVLGVNRTASAIEIRNAYRKLVQQLHPDINPNPDSLHRIQEVNEAYDVLGDDTKRRVYDFTLNNPYATISEEPAKPMHRDPAYKRPRQPVQSDTYSPRELMAMYLKYMRWICAACFCYALLIGFDFLIPQRETTESIENIYRVNSVSRYGHTSYSHDVMVMASGKEVILYENTAREFVIEKMATLHTTPVFKHVMSATVLSTSQQINTGIKYYTLWFMPALLCICSGLGLFLKGVDLPFNFGVISAVLFPITLYLYL